MTVAESTAFPGAAEAPGGDDPFVLGDDPFVLGGATLASRLILGTGGTHSLRALEAVKVSHLAREAFETDWVKLKVIGDDRRSRTCWGDGDRTPTRS